MLPALILFLLTYLLMLALPQYRPFAALGGAALFLALGAAGLWDFTLMDAARAVDFNVLLMMAGTMGTVSLFIESRMPARLAELLIVRVPNVKWAVCMLALFAGVISAFVDNVATVLMVAPVGLAIACKLKISPVPVLISIAVSSNLQGAATLVGDTTSILLGGFAGMNFFDFFWMEGRPGIFWGVELGALASLGVLFWLFRDQRQPVHVEVETKVEDDVPTALLLLTVGLLIAASFLPEPSGGVLHLLYTLRSGLVCMGLCLFGVARACWRSRSLIPLGETARALDYDTLLLLFSLFILLEGVSKAGVIDAAARLFPSAAGDEPLRLYLLLVAASVGLCLTGAMSLANALMAVIVSFLIFSQIQSAGSGVSALRLVGSSIDHANQVDDIPEMDQRGTAIRPESHEIVFDHVNFSYGSRPILKDVSLIIPDRTTTAIVGPSGSGKTTLCNLIARFWDVDGGRVTIGGRDVREYTLESLMEQVSMVFQRVYLFADTVENNIKFGCPGATHEQVVEAAKKACCHDFISALPDGYGTVIGEGGATLSGGEKQRISIARCLLKDAPIVIFDEATANVDPENEDQLQKAMEALTREKTVLMIAHRLKTVRGADQILVVDQGRVVQKGTHDELIQQAGIYRNFVSERTESSRWTL